MTIPRQSRFVGDEDALELWWFINGELADFTTGYTFQARLALASSPQTIIFTKTSGFSGAAGSGVEGDGTPNLLVTWATAGELNLPTTSGIYLLEIVATAADSTQSTMQMELYMEQRLGS